MCAILALLLLIPVAMPQSDRFMIINKLRYLCCCAHSLALLANVRSLPFLHSIHYKLYYIYTRAYIIYNIENIFGFWFFFVFFLLRAMCLYLFAPIAQRIESK